MSGEEEVQGDAVPLADGSRAGGGAALPELLELVRLEQQRLESQDRRNEIALRAIEADESSDKRQYDYHVSRLESEERKFNARLGLVAKVWLGIGGLTALFALVILYMMFFGTQEQARIAEKLLVWSFTALGGGGLLYAGQRGLRWITRY